MATISDLAAIDIRVGTVVSAMRVPETDKLLRLEVDLGEEQPRQIVSGIAEYVPEPSTLIGKQLAFVANLEPRTIRGIESRGMLFAVGSKETFAFLVPHHTVPPGTKAH